MRISPTVLSIAVVTAACPGSDKPDPDDDTATSVAYVCNGDFIDGTGSVPYVDAHFKWAESNFTCQTNPVEPEFLVNLRSFDPGTFITSADETSDESDLDNGILEAIEGAADSWDQLGWIATDDCLDIRVSGGTTEVKQDPWDALSVIKMSDRANFALASHSLALTSLNYDRSNPEDGAVSCDVELFTKGVYAAGEDVKVTPGGIELPAIRWDISGGSSGETSGKWYSLKSVVSHELGHCLGFSDNNIDEDITISTTATALNDWCAGVESDLDRSIMYKSMKSNATPEPDFVDCTAAVFLYCYFDAR